MLSDTQAQSLLCVQIPAVPLCVLHSSLTVSDWAVSSFGKLKSVNAKVNKWKYTRIAFLIVFLFYFFCLPLSRLSFFHSISNNRKMYVHNQSTDLISFFLVTLRSCFAWFEYYKRIFYLSSTSVPEMTNITPAEPSILSFSREILTFCTTHGILNKFCLRF